MSTSVKSLTTQLANRGPHQVQRGDLAFAGQPGVVFAPAEGFGLPAVAFGHGWMTSVHNYRTFLEHLASWGIVVAAPDTERGPLPSHRGLAADLSTALDICVNVRLGTGKISVHPDKLAVVGHGMGAGVAVLAAARRADVAAVGALFPATTAPPAATVAPSVQVPALVVAGATDLHTQQAPAAELAAAWGGPAVLRAVEEATDHGLVEGRRVLAALGAGAHEVKTSKSTRALLTGFLLHTLQRDDEYKAFADTESAIPRTLVIDPTAPPEVPPKSKARVVRSMLGR
ncbi:MAG TPA: dienelactone hydrolase family protein [Aldersonia sp.]